MTKPKSIPRIVLDTCCYFHFFTDQTPELAENVQGLIDNDGKNHVIIAPTVVLLETFGKVQNGIDGQFGSQPEKRQLQLDAAREWFTGQQFLPAELDQRTANIAIRLMYENKLKGMDASVIASAIAYGATTVYTYDKQMLRANVNIPEVEIVKPPSPDALFTVSQPPK